MEDDLTYFKRRASEERAAAKKATQLLERDTHLEMAERFEELANAILGRERELYHSSRR
ncbi:MAG: hypothetical protein ACR2JJ_05250 [Sphingomicrobium sp.]